MIELITIEAVNSKPKFPKFSNGSILAGGKWMNVDKRLDISAFKKNTQMAVKLLTNEKGYTSVVDIVEDVKPKTAIETTEAGITNTISFTQQAPTDPYYVRNGYGKPMSQYEIDLDRRISVAGITQAALASPSLAGLPYTNTAELVENVKKVAVEMMKFVDEQSK